jgi:hypothetical protein
MTVDSGETVSAEKNLLKKLAPAATSACEFTVSLGTITEGRVPFY